MTTTQQIACVLLADDHPAILSQAESVLASEFNVVGSVSNGADLLLAAARLDPDVVVLDITMPGLDGLETARQLRQIGSRAKSVFLTVHEDPDYVRAALEAGGAGYVVKGRLASDLVIAVHEALSGRVFVSPIIAWNPANVP